MTRTSVSFGVVGGRVGGGVDGRLCLRPTEQSGLGGGVLADGKGCQRNVFLELSCVVEMTVFFLTWTAAITSR